MKYVFNLSLVNFKIFNFIKDYKNIPVGRLGNNAQNFQYSKSVHQPFSITKVKVRLKYL